MNDEKDLPQEQPVVIEGKKLPPHLIGGEVGKIQGLDMISSENLPPEVYAQIQAAMAKAQQQNHNKKARRQTRASPLLGKLLGRM